MKVTKDIFLKIDVQYHENLHNLCNGNELPFFLKE